MTILKVRHVTTYTYARPVAFGEHRILSRPRDSYDQRLLHYELAISPIPSDLHWIHDAYGNCVAIANFDARDTTLRFESNIVLDHTPQDAPRFRAGERAKTWPIEYEPDTLPDLEACRVRQYPDAGEVAAWANRFVRPRRTDAQRLLAAMTLAIRDTFAYSRRTAPGTQPPLVTLETKQGTCRDFALLMIEAARALGLAARFVTGYIYVATRDGPELLGGGSTHAWVQVFLPGAGWIEFDPTNGIVGNRDLIRVGVARDPHQAIPLWGTYAGRPTDATGMVVQVNVNSAADAPHVPSLIPALT